MKLPHGEVLQPGELLESAPGNAANAVLDQILARSVERGVVVFPAPGTFWVIFDPLHPGEVAVAMQHEAKPGHGLRLVL